MEHGHGEGWVVTGHYQLPKRGGGEATETPTRLMEEEIENGPAIKERERRR